MSYPTTTNCYSSLGLLRDIYDDGGSRMLSSPSGGPSDSYNIVGLVEAGLVSTTVLSGSRVVCEITAEGIQALSRGAGRDLGGHVDKKINAQNLVIERAVENRFSVGTNLGLNTVSDFCQRLNLQIWGNLGGQSDPILVGGVNLTVIDAEAATLLGDLSIRDILNELSGMKAHTEAFVNNDLDGEIVSHIYELADMLDIPEAAGSNIIILQDLRVDPSLLGHGVGTRLVQKLMVRYGKGGGVLIAPLEPYGASKSSPAYQAVTEKLTQHFAQVGLGPHPFVDDYLVGNIRQIAGLPA